MDEPSLPFEALRSCLGADLLRAALTDVAPSATRARICRAIDSTLTGDGAVEPDVTRSTADSSCRATTGAAALSVGIPINAINSARVAPRPCAPPVRRSFRRFLPAIQLAAAVAVGVGSAAGARVLSPREPVIPDVGVNVSPSRSTQDAARVRVTEHSRGKRAAASALDDGSLRASVPRVTAERLPPTTEEPAEDWLGAQLSILSQADRSLRDGRPEEAMRSLEQYATLFPMGLLDPQVTLLRERAQLGEKRQVFIFP